MDMSGLRREKFSSKAKIDALPVADNSNVLADWNNPQEWLHESGWQLLVANTGYQDQGAVRGYFFGRGDRERLSIEIFVSSEGALPARNFFMRRALSSPLLNPPFKIEISDEVRALRLITSEQNTHNEQALLYLYKNVTFEIKSLGSSVNIRTIAESLLSIAMAHTEAPINDKRPVLPASTEIEVSLLASSPITIPLPEGPDDLGNFLRYRIQVRTEGDAVEFAGFENDNAKFRIEKSGVSIIHLQAVDIRNLLSRETIIIARVVD
jgi:hypothetical protein